MNNNALYLSGPKGILLFFAKCALAIMPADMLCSIAKRCVPAILGKFGGRSRYQACIEAIHKASLAGMNFGVSDIGRSGEIASIRHVHDTLKSRNETIRIFDVGANIGNFAKEAVSTFSADNCKIYCFEPSPETFRALCRNSASKNIMPFNFALGDSRGSFPLFVSERDSGLSSLYNRRLAHIGIAMRPIADVEVRTLDDVCLENGIEHIHFLKLDVEGNEISVLKGSGGLLSRGAIDFIQFEFGGCNIDSRTYFQDFYYMLGNTFDFFRICADGLYPVESYKESNEIFMPVNYLAQKKGL
jgi:FkbM family methyltransferase